MDEATGPKVVVYGDGSAEPLPVLLNEAEVRVLGALVEKQITTPDYYPLTLNALVNACNQTSSRDPVVSYDESTVTRALDGLRDQKLASVSSGAESRVLKFRHKLLERFDLDAAETAALCLLMLRGPQTPGEIRTRSGRLHEFASVADVETTLEKLSARAAQPLAVRLPRQPGFKESRFAHLLSGPPLTAKPEANSTEVSPESPVQSDLRVEVAKLREEVAELRQQFAEFRKQFE
jgi:uncharacterized protein YceH (UPF0502 family)